MYEIFEKLCGIRGITAYRFCKDTGVNASTISTWKKNNSLAGPDLSKKVCEYFDVSLDYLMTGNTNLENKESLAFADDRDIKKHIDIIMESLDGKDKIVFEGQEVNLTEQSKRMLRYAMEIAYEAAKNNNN